MGDKTGIEWTDATWNPVTGCDHVSPGCDHCYAEQMAKRLAGRAGYPADEPFRLTLQPDRLDQPLRWKRPRRIFVNSMSDLFHQGIPEDYIAQVFDVMVQARQHEFQVLTKRPQRMAKVLVDRPATPEEVDAGCELGIWPGIWDRVSGGTPAPNVWLGTSIESDRYCFRADHLRATPAAVRFLSLEPLLGPLPSLDLTGIDWVIVGGESGAQARPMHPQWARDLRDRCLEAGVPFLFKQAGRVLAQQWAMSDSKGHTLEELPEDLRIREFPT